MHICLCRRTSVSLLEEIDGQSEVWRRLYAKNGNQDIDKNKDIV